MPSDFNEGVIEEFRANGGKVGGWFENANLLLLHHTGARTGSERVNPLGYQQVGDGYAVFASANGSTRHPDRYRNLVAHPDTTVEVGSRTVKVRARVADSDERDAIYARQKEIAPPFAEYEKTAAPRVIPVVVLDPVA